MRTTNRKIYEKSYEYLLSILPKEIASKDLEIYLKEIIQNFHH